MSVILDLSDRIAVVTGAASGIGRAIALTLADAGATVAAVDRNAGRCPRDDRRARRRGHRAHCGPDRSGRDHGRAGRGRARRTGRPDVLVNAAGWDRIEPFMDNDDELWRDLTAINLLGPVRVSHAFLEPIIAAGTPARIVNIASDAGRVGSTGETVYAGTKGGVIAFTKSLAREMARHRINVNCVCPGPTDTPLLATMPDRLRRGWRRRSRFAASPDLRRSPTRSCSSPRTAPGTSPARS